MTLLEAEISSPHAVVVRLVQEALAVAEGRVLDVDALERWIGAAHELATHPALTERDRRAVLRDLRLCQLEPARPAPDLLEALLEGIDGCWQIWNEEAAADPDVDGDLDPMTWRTTARKPSRTAANGSR